MSQMIRSGSSLAKICTVVALVVSSTNWAADPVKPLKVSYYRDIWPIVRRECQGCHQPAKKLGGLSLTTHAGLLKGGKAGRGFVAGKPNESVLIDSLLGTNMSRMPKGADKLSDEQIALFKQWIAEGAVDDTPATAIDSISADNPPVYEGKPLITALAFSRDGKSLAVGGYREVLLHKADGSALEARLVGMSQRIQSIAYSPDGKLMAAVGGSPGLFGEVQIWDAASRKLKQSLEFTFDTLFGAGWTSDSKRLAFGCADNSVRVIDVEKGKQTLKYDHHTDFALAACFSLDDKHMVSISRDRAVKLTLTETGSFIDNITSITPGALAGGLEALDRHPRENQVLVGGIDGVPRIYKIFRTQARQIGDDFNLIRAFDKVPGRISNACFNADGSLIAIAGTGEARVYSVSDGKQIASVKFADGVYAVAFHPTNGTFAAGGYDGVIKIVDTKTNKLVREFVPVPLKPALANR